MFVGFRPNEGLECKIRNVTWHQLAGQLGCDRCLDLARFVDRKLRVVKHFQGIINLNCVNSQSRYYAKIQF